MLEQHARVVKVSDEGIWVEAVEPSGCGTCGGQGCSTRQIAELFQRKPRHFRVAAEMALSAGERVVVGMPEGGVVRIALYVYGLPLLMILAGALLANIWVPGDLPAVAGAAAGGIAAWGLTVWLSKRGKDTMRPVVLRRENFFVRRGT